MIHYLKHTALVLGLFAADAVLIEAALWLANHL